MKLKTLQIAQFNFLQTLPLAGCHLSILPADRRTIVVVFEFQKINMQMNNENMEYLLTHYLHNSKYLPLITFDVLSSLVGGWNPL